MYLQNKYTRWYNIIIDRARCRDLPKDIYTEKHHIVPKSIGGVDDANNLVRLTAKEHYICHLLLPKMTTGSNKRSMSHALWKIVNQRTQHQDRYKVTSRVYEMVKKSNANALREANSGKPNLFLRGKPKSLTHRKNLSASLKGYKFSEERNAKISKAHLGKKQPPRSVEWTNKQVESCLSNRRICEHCNNNVSFKTYQRWHGNRCKQV
jgi:hypothetical protein